MKHVTAGTRFVWMLATSTSHLAISEARAQSSADSVPLEWAVPTTMPPSALVAVLSGDPTGPDETTFLVAMPNGYRIAPHSHPSYVHFQVREGTLLVGMGDKLDSERTRTLAVGDSSTVPAGRNHFLIARGATVVTMTFIGPFAITYLRAADAPLPRAFPIGY